MSKFSLPKLEVLTSEKIILEIKKKKLSRNSQPLIEKERIGTNRSKGEKGKEG